jgi:hypothetical protein
MSEDELNAAVQAGPDTELFLKEAGVRGPQLRLREGRLVLNAYFLQGGAELYVTLEAVPRATQNGRLSAEIVDIRVGRVTAPAPLRIRLQSEVDRLLAQIGGRITPRIEAVEVHDRYLIVTGRSAALPPRR